MDFNIYLNTNLGAALARLAKRRKVTRNALIREAVEDLLEKESHSQYWSEAVLTWQGAPDVLPFESHRTKRNDPAADPLA